LHRQPRPYMEHNNSEQRDTGTRHRERANLGPISIWETARLSKCRTHYIESHGCYQPKVMPQVLSKYFPQNNTPSLLEVAVDFGKKKKKIEIPTQLI